MINKKSVIGNMDANVVLIVMYILAIILYLLPGARYFAWGIPLILYLFENKNEFIRKQSVQAVMLFMVGSLFAILIYLLQLALVPVTYVQYAEITLIGFRSFLLGIVNIIFCVGTVVILAFSCIDMIRVYNYYDYEIPFLGKGIKPFRSILDKIVGEVNTEEGNIGTSISDYEDENFCVAVGELIKNSKFKEDKETEIKVDNGDKKERQKKKRVENDETK